MSSRSEYDRQLARWQRRNRWLLLRFKWKCLLLWIKTGYKKQKADEPTYY